MSKIAGITIDRKLGGGDFNLIINYKKQPDLVNRILKEQGIENPESPYDPEFVAKIRKSETEPSVKVDLSKYGIEI